jgi:hypothetical protein|nr:MAG TPA: RimK-related lysine biosynthesis protein, Probable-dependent amine/thiol ligase family Amino-group [Caudoviricetes sp.]
MQDKGIMLIQNEDGTFSEYDDSNDVIISCKNEEQCKEVVELLKRHLKPVKPIERFTGNEFVCECPTCHGLTDAPNEVGIQSVRYCSWCGQKLDWRHR